MRYQASLACGTLVLACTAFVLLVKRTSGQGEFVSRPYWDAHWQSVLAAAGVGVLQLPLALCAGAAAWGRCGATPPADYAVAAVYALVLPALTGCVGGVACLTSAEWTEAGSGEATLAAWLVIAAGVLALVLAFVLNAQAPTAAPVFAPSSPASGGATFALRRLFFILALATVALYMPIVPRRGPEYLSGLSVAWGGVIGLAVQQVASLAGVLHHPSSAGRWALLDFVAAMSLGPMIGGLALWEGAWYRGCEDWEGVGASYCNLGHTGLVLALATAAAALLAVEALATLSQQEHGSGDDAYAPLPPAKDVDIEAGGGIQNEVVVGVPVALPPTAWPTGTSPGCWCRTTTTAHPLAPHLVPEVLALAKSFKLISIVAYFLLAESIIGLIVFFTTGFPWLSYGLLPFVPLLVWKCVRQSSLNATLRKGGSGSVITVRKVCGEVSGLQLDGQTVFGRA